MPTLSSRLVSPLRNCCRCIATRFALIILAGSVQFALAVPTLTLTEQSSLTLLWSWNAEGGSGSGSIPASSKVPPPNDQWNSNITGPALSATSTTQLTGAWQEPGSTTLFNNVTVKYTVDPIKGNSWNVSVVSDASATAGFTHYADGATATYSGDTVSYSVIFIDQAAASEVPEGGATVIMLSLAVGCLAIMKRRIAAA